MKYPPQTYAKFMLNLANESSETRTQKIKRLVDLLYKSGDIKDWKHISEIYSAMKEKKDSRNKAIVRYAKKVDKKKLQNLLSPLIVEFVEDNSLVDGFRIEVGDKRYEDSLFAKWIDFKKQLTF
jgi:F0F1-type ATP synthase delta subunit